MVLFILFKVAFWAAVNGLLYFENHLIMWMNLWMRLVVLFPLLCLGCTRLFGLIYILMVQNWWGSGVFPFCIKPDFGNGEPKIENYQKKK